MRNLVLVAVIAIVFGGGAGYLGGSFERSRVTGEAAAQDSQPIQFATQQEERRGAFDRFADALEQDQRERRLKCIEDKAARSLDRLNALESGLSPSTQNEAYQKFLDASPC